MCTIELPLWHQNMYLIMVFSTLSLMYYKNYNMPSIQNYTQSTVHIGWINTSWYSYQSHNNVVLFSGKLQFIVKCSNSCSFWPLVPEVAGGSSQVKLVQILHPKNMQFWTQRQGKGKFRRLNHINGNTLLSSPWLATAEATDAAMITKLFKYQRFASSRKGNDVLHHPSNTLLCLS